MQAESPHKRRNLILFAAVVVVMTATVVLAAVFFWGAGDLADSDPQRGSPPESSKGNHPNGPPALPVSMACDFYRVRGIVLDFRGRPGSSGIQVQVLGRGGGEVVATSVTAVNGRFVAELPPPSDGADRYVVRAHDSATGGTSGRVPYTARVGEPGEWLVVRLHRTALVTGRVLDQAGHPAPDVQVRVSTDRILKVVGAPWKRAISVPDRADVRTNEEGRFAARLRWSTGGGAGALGPDRVLGPVKRFVMAEQGDTDAGDIMLPGARTCTWTLRFVDDAGAPVPDVLVRFGPAELWEMQLHRAFDPGIHFIRVGKEGVLELPLRMRDKPALIGVGSPTHRCRTLALDCRSPGVMSEAIRLSRRPSARLVIAGPDLERARRRGFVVDVLPLDRQRPAGELSQAFDLLAGKAIQVPPADHPLPIELVEAACRRERIQPTDDGYAVRMPQPGEYAVRCGVPGGSAVRGRLYLREEPREPVVELRLPEGRWAVLDLEALHQWADAEGAGAWLSAFAAWPVPANPETVADGRCMARNATVLLGERGRGRKNCLPMWLPEETTAVAFAFIEDTFLGDPVALARPVLVQTVFCDAGDVRISAPVPREAARAAVAATLSVNLFGEPLKQDGISIDIFRAPRRPVEDGAPNGSATVITDSEGTARVRLFPGLYSCSVSADIVDRPTETRGWPRLNVLPGGPPVALRLDLVFQR